MISPTVYGQSLKPYHQPYENPETNLLYPELEPLLHCNGESVGFHKNDRDYRVTNQFYTTCHGKQERLIFGFWCDEKNSFIAYADYVLYRQRCAASCDFRSNLLPPGWESVIQVGCGFGFAVAPDFREQGFAQLMLAFNLATLKGIGIHNVSFEHDQTTDESRVPGRLGKTSFYTRHSINPSITPIEIKTIKDYGDTRETRIVTTIPTELSEFQMLLLHKALRGDVIES